MLYSLCWFGVSRHRRNVAAPCSDISKHLCCIHTSQLMYCECEHVHTVTVALTSRASPGSCWAPRCAGVGVDRPVSSAPPAPTPWRRSWASWRAAWSCFRSLRAPALARGSSRSSWAPGSPPHGFLRGSARPRRRIWRTSSPPPSRQDPPAAAAAARGEASRPRQPHRRNGPGTGSDCRPTSRDWAQPPIGSAPLWTSSYTHNPLGAQMM